ncbi:MAG: tetratricopeptide repeat protein [Cyclobacteriaceae bacterium]|nr:tetratricopeptide repeat protein [Cyclobacteriaceae bacterium]
MPSLLPDYKCDIFISYRHNDNRSGWVTEFVNALQEELGATIKEPLSIYFDKNPHDGLLETHNVDKSLEGKLKCLIFIPIISQTYCDPKSFAWQHEFLVFNKMASETSPFSSGEGLGMRSFGRDITLTNGNVTSRILPIKIHELDAEDKTVIENEIGGALRAIEFIYKEAGVNRPLKLTDSKTDNQNKTDYRNQVNKVANSIKEIITALKNPVVQTTNNNQTPKKPTNTKSFLAIGVPIILLAIAGYFVYPKISSGEETENKDKSIAVLLFKNISPDNNDNYFAEGMTEEVINYLAKVSELKVISRTSIEQYKGLGKDIKTIARELGVSHILEGSVRKAGNKFRISVKLIEASKGFQVWSNEYDRDITDILQVQSEISKEVTDALKIVLTESERTNLDKVAKVELTAYDFYLKGRNELVNFQLAGPIRGKAQLNKAIDLFKKSLQIDPKFSKTHSGLGLSMLYKGSVAGGGVYIDKTLVDSAKLFSDVALQLDNKNDEAYYLQGVYYNDSGNFDEAILNFNKALSINPNNVEALVRLGLISEDFVTALAQIQRAISLDRGPDLVVNLRKLGEVFTTIGLFKNGEEYYKIAAGLDNDSSGILRVRANLERANQNYQAGLNLINIAYNSDSTNWFHADEKAWILSLMGRYKESLNIRLEWKKLLKGDQATMANRIAYLYSKLGDKRKADEYFRLAINNAEEAVRKNDTYAQWKFAHYDLAGIYAFLGEKEKAYQYLNEVNKRKIQPVWFLTMMQDDQLFESIRNEERFQKIFKQMESRTLAERDRVIKWLESEEMKTKIEIK